MMAGRNDALANKRRLRSQHGEEPSSSVSKKRRLESSVGLPVSAAAATSSKPPQPDGFMSRRRRKAAVDSYEVPDSDEEQVEQTGQPDHDDAAKPQKSQAQASRRKASLYDLPHSSEDELGSSAVQPRPGRHRPTNAAVDTSGVNGIGRASLANEGKLENKKRGGHTKRDHEAKAGELSRTEDEESKDVAPPPGKSISETRRSRRAPNGTSNKVLPVPKGILTPQKGKNANSDRQKSVVFDRGLERDSLGDIAAGPPSKLANTRKGRSRAKVTDELQVDDELQNDIQAEHEDEEPGNDEEDDDEVCTICLKPDSEEGNQIVFCDGCDAAVHQECYGLSDIPKGDWFCRNCSQNGASSTTKPGSKGTEPCVNAQEDQKPDIPNFDQHLRSMQRVLLDRCAGRRWIKLRGQDEAYEKAYQLVEQTVVAGEGNSMLVIGARGCGKTTLVESVIAEMSGRHQDQFHVVRLNGFIHTDDKLALREIWRQLGKEMEVEDELVNKTTNHADTMASLLALLSHPSEIAEGLDGVTSKSIVFVMDEFDLFATHSRQTLLYNLFDIAQARKAPIAVLGLTTRIDVVESLEKRVKSRFSHRYVYLSPPKSLPAYWDVCRQGLIIDDEDMVAEGIDRKLQGHGAFWDWWNGKIEALHKTPEFTDHLETHFYSTKSVPAFLTTCILPLAALSPTTLSLRIAGPSVSNVSLEAPDSKLHLLGSLSDLDLWMLIAAARLDIVAHTDTVNFAMAYDEYTSLMSKQRVQSASSGMLALAGGARVWGRGTAGMAWERLVTLGLLVPAAAGGRGTAGLGGLDAKMFKVDVALEEIPAAVKLNAVMSRWCREI